MELKKTPLAIVLSLALAVTTLPAVAANQADTNANAVGSQAIGLKHRREMVELSAHKLSQVRAALANYYADNNSWPASLNDLATGNYYSGDFSTPYGTITGALSATGYDVQITVPAGSQQTAVTKMIAAKTAGTAAGAQATVTVETPSVVAIAQGLLSRRYDPSNPDANKMETNINMNGFSILGASQLQGVTLDVTTGTISEDLDVARDVTIGRNLKVAGATEFDGATTFDGAATFNASSTFKDATFENAVLLMSGVTIQGVSSLENTTTDDLQVNGTFIAKGGSTFEQGINAKQGLNVTGGILDVDVDTVIDGKLTLNGDLLMPANSNFVGGNGEFKGSFVVQGATTLGSATINDLQVSNGAVVQGRTTTDSLGVIGDAEVGRDLYVRRNATVDGELTVIGVTTAGAIRSNGGYFASGQRVVSDDGSQLYEGGVSLKDKYGQLTGANTFTGVNTFTQLLNANGGIMVDGKWVVSTDGNTLYEGGVALSSKYLGINDKAASAATADYATNAGKLGGVAANQYARRDQSNTFTGTNTFNQLLNANGGIMVDGKWVVSADGNTLYEGGVALSSKYLGVNAKAKDADRLDGIDSSQFARTDIDETFTRSLIINGVTTTKGKLYSQGGIDSAGAVLVRSTFRSMGVATFDTTTRVNGTLHTRNVSTTGTITASGDVKAGSKGLIAAYDKAYSAYSLASSAKSKADSAYSKAVSLEQWKAACRANARSAECGLSNLSDGDGGGGSYVVYSGSATSGTLSRSVKAGTQVVATLGGTITKGYCNQQTFADTTVDNHATGSSVTVTRNASMGSCANSVYKPFKIVLTVTGNTFSVSTTDGASGGRVTKITFIE